MTKKEKIWIIPGRIEEGMKHPSNILEKYGSKLKEDTDGLFSYYIYPFSTSTETENQTTYGYNFNVLWNGKNYSYNLFNLKSNNLDFYPLVLTYIPDEIKIDIKNDIELEKELIKCIKSETTSKLLSKIKFFFEK